jgi:N6-adenosine-specific RNA methylase IME4
MIQIDPEFQALIPPLAPEERQQLEANIIADGCRDPLVVWDGVLIDGHNRYEICTRNGVPYSKVDREFESRGAVKVWMIDNQKGRRNLTDGWKFELVRVRKSILLDKGKANKQGRGKVLSIVDKTNTQQELATELGWSTGKVAMADKVWSVAEPEVLQEIKAGEKTINEAYQAIKKREKKTKREADIQAQREAIEAGSVKSTDGVFDVIAMDPPWNYGREYDPDGSRVANPYPEMTQSQLLELRPPFADDCVLFLWTTHAFMFDAKELLDSWGFTYKACLVWDKEKIGMGAWLRMQCEFCLVGIKGKPYWNNTTYRDVIREPRREHSRKPDAFYKLVEDVTAGRRLEFFSRERREGWEVFGNDTEKF